MPNFKKDALFPLWVFIFLFIATSAYAANENKTLTREKINALIQQSFSKDALPINVTPEVVTQINAFRNNPQARSYIISALNNMTFYQPVIIAELKNKAMPDELLALPLIQSGYQPLDETKNPYSAAGIWQILPGIAKNYGLVVDIGRDDRYNTKLATRAALSLLKSLHSRYGDWRLAVIAYAYGNAKTDELIETTGSRDPWTIAYAPTSPKELKDYLALFDAAIIIMRHPSLIKT